jgi:hypothetical protein
MAPLAVAEFVTRPVSTSPWAITYVPVQVITAFGARVGLGQVIGEAAPDPPEVNVSATETPARVTLPVFRTTNEYVTV